MAPLTFVTLPPEIRHVIYSFAYPAKDIVVEPLGSRFHPTELRDNPTQVAELLAGDMIFGESDEPNPARISRLFSGNSNPDTTSFTQVLTALPDCPLPPARSLAGAFPKLPARGKHATTTGHMCSKCGEATLGGSAADSSGDAIIRPRTTRKRCWKCMNHCYGLLYTSRFVYNESISIYHSQVRPAFSDNAALLRFIYCAWSHGHQALVREIALSFDPWWRTDFMDDWREGALRHALPGLKSLKVIFGSRSVHFVDDEVETATADVVKPGLLQIMGPSLTSFYKGGKGEVTVLGLRFSETAQMIERAMKSGSLEEWDAHDFMGMAEQARKEEQGGSDADD